MSFFALPILAASTDVIIGNTTMQAVKFRENASSTADLLIIATSSAESLTIDNGVLTVTNPDTINTFKVGSSDSLVKAITVKNGGGALVTCQENTVLGSSYVVLPSTADNYIIEPSTAVSCQSFCASLTGADGYNHFPTCGAAACSAGYTISGDGASAICNVNAVPAPSGGGGMSADVPKIITTYQEKIAADGTKVIKEGQVIKINNIVTTEIVETTFKPSGEIKEAQAVSLNTAQSAEVKEVKLELPLEILNELTGASSKEIKIRITSREASPDQKTSQARNGLFLIGYDVFKVDITVGGERVKAFSKPLTLYFDITRISNPADLKAYYYDTNNKMWKMAGDGGKLIAGQLAVAIDYLAEFSLMKEIKSVTQKEVLSKAALHWQQVANDAYEIFQSGLDLNGFLSYLGKKKDQNGQIDSMKKHSKDLTKDVKNITASTTDIINNYLVYGTKGGSYLTRSDRADVIRSYKKAFGRLPSKEDEWRDAVAIASGRWPAKTDKIAEASAKKEFKKIYKRNANDKNDKDRAAINMLAYGMRPISRNVNSEKSALKIYKNNYKASPKTFSDWNIVRAIAYSGVKK